MSGKFAVGISADKKVVRVRLTSGGQEAISADLEASELDNVIEQLGIARAQMAEQVSESLDEVSRVRGMKFPQFRVSKHVDGKTLTLRHKGYGWLAYVLSPVQVKKLVDNLVSF